MQVINTFTLSGDLMVELMARTMAAMTVVPMVQHLVRRMAVLTGFLMVDLMADMLEY